MTPPPAAALLAAAPDTRAVSQRDPNIRTWLVAALRTGAYTAAQLAGALGISRTAVRARAKKYRRADPTVPRPRAPERRRRERPPRIAGAGAPASPAPPPPAPMVARRCLRCRAIFESREPVAVERVCGECKGSRAWREGDDHHSLVHVAPSRRVPA